MALRFGLPLDRLRGLEQDATLPTIDEVFLLCDVLQVLPPTVLRHVRGTGRALLDEAWTPYTQSGEAYAARSVPDVKQVEEEALHLLPEPLQVALCDALRLRRSDRTGLQHAWSELRTRPEAQRDMLFDAAVAQMLLEGEPLEDPLVP
jgi:hypothetical protein